MHLMSGMLAASAVGVSDDHVRLKSWQNHGFGTLLNFQLYNIMAPSRAGGRAKQFALLQDSAPQGQ